MPPQNNNQQTGFYESPGFVIFVLLLLLFVALAIIWIAASPEISAINVSIRSIELRMVRLFTDHQVIEESLRWMAITDPASMEVRHLGETAAVVGYFVRWLSAPLLCLFGVLVFLRKPQDSMRETFNLQQFMHYQATAWPVIWPALAQDLNSEAWAFSLQPLEWLKARGIAHDPCKTVDFKAAKDAFTEQLGTPWRGLDDLPLHALTILAMCALRGARRRADARMLINDMAVLWGNLKPDLDVIREAIAPIIAGAYVPPLPSWAFFLPSFLRRRIKRTPINIIKPVLSVAGHHAFYTTAIAAAVMWARDEGGIFPPADFLWLKPIDRNLWYALSALPNHAYQAPTATCAQIEAAGSMAHFFAEKRAGHALHRPVIDQALVGLAEYCQVPLP